MKQAQKAGLEGEEAFIARIKTRMNELLRAAKPDAAFEAAGGKMLRGRLVYAMGGPDLESALAVELMHSGSLLHDDVIDDAALRRRLPAFWKTYGIKGAILFGDLHFFLALRLLSNQPRRLQELVDMAGMVCEAAAAEELADIPDNRTELARRKTGPLFAFAAMSGATNEENRTALREAGFLLGTAYQLADDIYDATGDEQRADKSLRRDKLPPAENATTIEALCEESAKRLADWPDLQEAWNQYLARHIHPAIAKLTARASC